MKLPTLPGPYIGFQLKHIGDLLHTIPALGFFKKHFPGEKFSLALAPQVAELALGSPLADEVLIIDRKAGPLAFARTIANIRRKKFKTAFIFDGGTRSIVAARLAGIKNRVGASGLYPLAFRALYTLDVDIGADPLDSQARRGQNMLAGALGLPPEAALRPTAPGDSIDSVLPLLGELSGRGPLVGLTLRGRQHEKTWPLRHFADLCQKLWKSCSARIFVMGGPDESPLAEALIASSGVPAANFCGRTTLSQVVELARAGDLIITVDTGVSHLAALTETPLVSIFIWTSPALWPPQSPQAHLMCYEWALARFGLAASDGPWLSAPVITPDMVFAKAMEILSKR